MCLILFSFEPEASRRLVVLANRDEFHSRPAAQASFWPDHPDILAGRDLEAGGTWLGISTGGRFAAITNFRQPGDEVLDAHSRGELTTDFLASSVKALDFAHDVAAKGSHYRGFVLLLFDGSNMVCVSNRDHRVPLQVTRGIHGLSNHLLDTPWPKVKRGKAKLAASLLQNPDLQTLLPLMLDTGVADDVDLPDTGIGLEWERMLSATCIRGPNYGTRCSTAVEIRDDHTAQFIERTLVPAGLDRAQVEFNLRLR